MRRSGRIDCIGTCWGRRRMSWCMRSGGYVRVVSESATTTEVRVIAAARAGAKLEVVEPRREGHEYYVDHRGEEFFIWTNDTGRNFRLVRAPVNTPGEENWREVV